MPKPFCSAVRFFFVRATRPSNISQRPLNIKQRIASSGWWATASPMPVTTDSRLR